MIFRDVASHIEPYESYYESLGDGVAFKDFQTVNQNAVKIDLDGICALKRSMMFVITNKRGEYGYVKLTDDEYNRLAKDLGQTEMERVIACVDECAATTGNKNQWKNWNLVLRKASREKWGVNGKQTQVGRVAELDADGRVIT